MENFTNETIDTARLPKFEEVLLTPLHPNYWKVTIINLLIFFSILGTALGLFLFYVEEALDSRTQILIGFAILASLIFFFSRIAYKKKGFAFRNHDVLFRNGIIATNTIVIPYNRVQHVALHEGLVSRYFGLAKIEIFTAGGSSSDIEIPGIQKEQAENIKQLLMGKIQKQL
ncbi:MAG: PH domain-containing protein [Bacteroidota bacterium]